MKRSLHTPCPNPSGFLQYIFEHTGPHHIYTHSVPICHSGRWAFHHTGTVHSNYDLAVNVIYLTSSTNTHHDGITHAAYTGPHSPCSDHWSGLIWCTLELKEPLWLFITTTLLYVSILPTVADNTSTFHIVSEWIHLLSTELILLSTYLFYICLTPMSYMTCLCALARPFLLYVSAFCYFSLPIFDMLIFYVPSFFSRRLIRQV